MYWSGPALKHFPYLNLYVRVVTKVYRRRLIESRDYKLYSMLEQPAEMIRKVVHSLPTVGYI